MKKHSLWTRGGRAAAGTAAAGAVALQSTGNGSRCGLAAPASQTLPLPLDPSVLLLGACENHKLTGRTSNL